VKVVALAADYLIMGFAQTLWVLLLGRIVAGVAGSTHVTAKAYIADISPPEKRAASFGMIGAAFGIGFILGPVIGGLLGEWGTRAPFFAAATLAIINFCYGYFVLPESLLPEQRRKFSLAKSNPFSGLLLARRFPALGWIFISLFLFSIAHFVYPAVWSYWGTAVFSWSSFEIGVSLALVGVGYAVIQGWAIRRIIPRFGEATTAYVAFAVTALSLLFFAFVTNDFYVYLLLPLVAVGALVSPSLEGILSNAIPDDEQGMLQGVNSGLTAIATIISPLVMTWLFYYFTDAAVDRQFPGAPYILSLLLTALSAAAFWKGVGGSNRFDGKYVKPTVSSE